MALAGEPLNWRATPCTKHPGHRQDERCVHHPSQKPWEAGRVLYKHRVDAPYSLVLIATTPRDHYVNVSLPDGPGRHSDGHVDDVISAEHEVWLAVLAGRRYIGVIGYERDVDPLLSVGCDVAWCKHPHVNLGVLIRSHHQTWWSEGDGTIVKRRREGGKAEYPERDWHRWGGEQCWKTT